MASPAVDTKPNDRDSWCTPSWLTELLPEVDLDPCGNERSTVKSLASYRLDRGEDGLALPWLGSIYCNPPFSNILPWAQKLNDEPVWAAAFLVNVDPSTAWWRELTKRLRYALFFRKRIQFAPPSGVKPSTNSKPQALLMDPAFESMLSATACGKLYEFGSRWEVLS